MATQKLSDLREPPVVGQFYLVPVVRDYPYNGRIGNWPVIGPKHEDGDFFNFPDQHYHVDARFLTAAQERSIVKPGSHYGNNTVEEMVQSKPLASKGSALPKGRPALARRKCRRATYGYAFGAMEPVQALRAHYGDRPEAIMLADGRALCPHRKADLSQFPPDDDGLVTCPLHGLRVCVRSNERTPA